MVATICRIIMVVCCLAAGSCVAFAIKLPGQRLVFGINAVTFLFNAVAFHFNFRTLRLMKENRELQRLAEEREEAREARRWN